MVVAEGGRGWLGAMVTVRHLSLLFGQDQFAVAGEVQAVFAAAMQQDGLAAPGQQRLDRDPRYRLD